MSSQINIYHSVHTALKMVAFTFDDGPNPQYTPEVLDIFNECNGKATFFMIGEKMKEYPDIVSDVVLKDHEIGNHTWSHPMLTQLNQEKCREELELTHSIIMELTGSTPAIFRPPFFDYNEEVNSVVMDFNYDVIGALNPDATDWEMPGVEHIISKSRNHIGNGSILLFHDGFGDRSQTVEAVRTLVQEVLSDGYQLVTISELLKSARK
ncbi:polysaccharide deacetylase family protein [Evansella tamaricis]|uniref:Polysaccharide deacetylase family protein n=1 Tax=Evansella tamaricis TaxID=2069301 RepID=A0ABS6JKR1_9BACI|nr:polysaccharide deacetylase family protein [Evansella tamaricis]MBU9712898.1 polysaccharide deacetylase family protein [Evansella tamaricis]